MKDPHGRIARWFVLLSQFDFDIQYRPGSENANADYLSRPAEEVLAVIEGQYEPELMAVTQYLTHFNCTGASPKVARAVKVRAKKYLCHEQILYRRTVNGLKYVPPLSDRPKIVQGLHDEIGHWGIDATYEIITGHFWWPKVRPEVDAFVRSCDVCQKTNPPPGKHPYSVIPISGLFHTWSVDFAGPLPETTRRYVYIIIAVEHLSNWPIAVAIPQGSFNSLGVIDFVRKHICDVFENPAFMVSDNGTQFNSLATKEFAEKEKIEWKFTSPYNPRGNAKAERMVG